MAIYLVTTNALREHGLFDSNIDEDDLKMAITLAQDTMLRDILGSKLFDKIIELAESGDLLKVDNEDYLELVRGPIRSVLIYYTFYNLLSLQSVRVNNSGISKSDREGSTPATLEDIRALKSTIKGYFSSYEDALRHYLVTNKDKFSPYFDYTDDDVAPVKTNRVKGLVDVNRMLNERDN